MSMFTGVMRAVGRVLLAGLAGGPEAPEAPARGAEESRIRVVNGRRAGIREIEGCDLR